MRLNGASWLVLAAVAGAACSHNDVVTIISRDGTTAIPSIDLTTNASAGLLSGSRAVNRFLASGPFDTTVGDAFARATANPPNFRLDVNGYYGLAASLIYIPGAPGIATFAPVSPYKPLLVGAAYASNGGFAPNAVAYIVPAGHPGNGATNTIWEFWNEMDGLTPSTRYVMGLARYALQVNGALDISEKLLTGTVTQPDSLVFRAGDNVVGGRKKAGVFTTNCASLNIVQPVAGANPHLLASDISDATGYIEFDQTACANAASAWGNLGTSKSPIPANNNGAFAANQYNFYVIWEALADSTPNYAKPAWRYQVGPLLTTTGQIVNNSYAPFPAAALTALQLGPLPGATSRPDTMKLTFNNLKQLSSGAYQVWLLRTDSASNQLVTGRVVRLNGATVVDTLNNVSEFNLTATTNAARAEFDLAPYTAASWNAATLAVASTTGNTTLPTSQPLWTKSVYKFAGQLASLSGNLVFGSFNRGTGSLLFGPVGSGTGGLFGRELREDVLRLPRPPVGYMYEGWLINSATPANNRNLGPILKPYPDLTSLVDADILQSAPLSGVELTQSAIRFVGDSVGSFCQRVGTTTAFAKAYTQVQVRLAPKNGTPTVLTPSIVLSGTFAMAPRTVNDSVKACN